MAQENLKNLSAEKLIKRAKFIYGIFGVVIGIFIVYVVVFVFQLFSTDTAFEFVMVVPIIALAATLLPMRMGLKNIKQELKSRGIVKIK